MSKNDLFEQDPLDQLIANAIARAAIDGSAEQRHFLRGIGEAMRSGLQRDIDGVQAAAIAIADEDPDGAMRLVARMREMIAERDRKVAAAVEDAVGNLREMRRRLMGRTRQAAEATASSARWVAPATGKEKDEDE